MTSGPQVLAQQWQAGLEEVPRCPACADPRRETEWDDLQDRSFGAAPGTWSLKRCLGCRALYLDPRPDATSIHLAYRNYYTHVPAALGPGSAIAWVRKALGNAYRNRIFGTSLQPSVAIGGIVTPLFTQTATRIRREDRGLGHAGGAERRILDVGCGNGEFLQWARQLGWRCYGVEMDAEASRLARAQGAEILGSQLQELGPAHDQFFDAITLSHVIEHVYDPVDTLRHCWRLLSPGGYLWIETPNTDSVGYEIYGPHWRGLEPPRHLVLFNPSALRSSLERAGFERIRMLPPSDVAERIFTLSAAMQLGRVAETDASPLPTDVRKKVRASALKARVVIVRDPGRSEFVTAVAYRP